MTEPSIAEQATSMLCRLAAFDPRRPANVHQMREVVGMVAALARRIEQQGAS